MNVQARDTLDAEMLALGRAARDAAAAMREASTEQKNRALIAGAEAIRASEILFGGDLNLVHNDKDVFLRLDGL